MLTNHHVDRGRRRHRARAAPTAAGSQAHVRGTDPESDLAVLKADGENLPAITFGTLEHVQVGDVVLAIGNPFGFGNTVTHGHRQRARPQPPRHQPVRGLHPDRRRDQPGNSGGALVDAAGNLIGINSTIFSQSGGSLGIGFAIPVSLARTVLEQIIKDGEVTRGWFGIEPQDVTRRDRAGARARRHGGVLIRGVRARAARPDRAGMQVQRRRRRHRRQADARHARAARAHRRAARPGSTPR